MNTKCKQILDDLERQGRIVISDYEFPKPFPLELRLKDMLEETVDEKYYLSDMVQERFQLTDETFTKDVIGTTKPDFRTIGQRDLVYQENSVMGSLVATDYKQPKQLLVREATKKGYAANEKINVVGMLDIKGNEQVRRVYGTGGLSPTLNTMQGGHRQPKVLVREATKKGYAEAEVGDSVNIGQPNSKTRRGRV